MTDHAEATAELLEWVARLLREGEVPEDWGATVVLIGRMMARRS